MPASVMEHSDFMYVIIVALIAVIVWLLKGWHKNLYSTLEKISETLATHTLDITAVKLDIAEIKGEHYVYHKGRRATDVIKKPAIDDRERK